MAESSDKFRALIEALGMNQAQASRFLDINERTGRRYAEGTWPVPPIASMLLSIMVKYKISPAKAREIGGLPPLD